MHFAVQGVQMVYPENGMVNGHGDAVVCSVCCLSLIPRLSCVWIGTKTKFLSDSNLLTHGTQESLREP